MKSLFLVYNTTLLFSCKNLTKKFLKFYFYCTLLLCRLVWHFFVWQCKYRLVFYVCLLTIIQNGFPFICANIYLDWNTETASTSTENLLITGKLQRAPSLPRTYSRNRSGIPVANREPPVRGCSVLFLNEFLIFITILMYLGSSDDRFN